GAPRHHRCLHSFPTRRSSDLENWTFVAETYQGYLDDESGESDEVRDVAVAAAIIYDRRLNNVDAAYVAYRRALGIESDDKPEPGDRKSTRLNSSHVKISYAVF